MKRARDPDQFRKAMKARGLTVREVGLLAGCSDGMVRFVMAGEKSTSPERARRLARVLRRPVGELFVDAVSSDEQRPDLQKAAG